MNTYELYDTNNKDIFYKICKSIEDFYPEFIKEKEVMDVDGSIIVSYSNVRDKIMIVNDETWDFIFSKTTLDLTNFIKQLKIS